MKKQRGLKRYYRKLSTTNDFISRITWLDFNSPDIWFDYWHVHFDNHGYGNKSFKRRKPHLDMMFRHYEIAALEMNKLNKEFQLWIFINDFTSYNDGIFFHTPNPNEQNYPHKYSEIRLECNLKNGNLINYLNEHKDFERVFGTYYEDEKPKERFCALYKSNIGQSVI